MSEPLTLEAAARRFPALEVELSPEGRNLYVFFGGIQAGIAMPVFEFYNASRILDQNKIFIRDLNQAWYQCGLYGRTRGLHDTVALVAQEIAKMAPDKVYFVGNSMGGYAAILFSELLGLGEVIAFAPQTFISPWLRRQNGDMRWPAEINKTWRRTWFRRKVWDLRPLLLKPRTGRRISLFVSTTDALDQVHAAHISDLPCVIVHQVEGGGHAVVTLLRDQGLLPAIMAGQFPTPLIPLDQSLVPRPRHSTL